MTMSRAARLVTRVGSAVAVAALGVSLAACSAEPEPAAGAAASASASAKSSASPSPTKLSPKEKAVEQAEKVLREYYRLEGMALRAPKKFDPKKFEAVAIGSALTYVQDMQWSAGYAGQHQVGERQLDSVEVLAVDLTHKPKQTPPEIPYVEFKICLDISAMETLNKDGKPALPADSKRRLVYQAGVVNYEYPTSGQWRVAYVEYQEEETC
jgi:hypothetical protein